MMEMKETTKICLKCKKSKSIYEFCRAGRSKDGYEKHCITCREIAKVEKSKIVDKQCSCCGNIAEHILRKYIINGELLNICDKCLQRYNIMELKQCSKCGISKPVDQYYESRITEDKLFDMCKSCCKTHKLRSKMSRRAQDLWYFGNKIIGD